MYSQPGPALLRGFPESAGAAAPMDHAHGIGKHGVCKAGILHIHLARLKVPVGIVVQFRPTGPKAHFDRLAARECDPLAADEIAALAAHFDIIHRTSFLSAVPAGSLVQPEIPCVFFVIVIAEKHLEIPQRHPIILGGKAHKIHHRKADGPRGNERMHIAHACRPPRLGGGNDTGDEIKHHIGGKPR